MNRSIPDALERLGELKVGTRSGLFTDFLAQTGNGTLLHRKSTKVTGHLFYGQPTCGTEIALGEVLARIPDLSADYASVSAPQFAEVDKISDDLEAGLQVELIWDNAAATAEAYRTLGYSVGSNGGQQLIQCSPATFHSEPPMFVNTYVQKILGSIPNLYVAVPFPRGLRLSQLGMTYVTSYVLGMLVRYYPTHWIALINGCKGDRLWPTINRAQQYIEIAYPELVAEYVEFAMDNPAQIAEIQSTDEPG